MRKPKVSHLFERLKKQYRIRRKSLRLILLVFFCTTFLLSSLMLASHYGQTAREEQRLKELAALTARHIPPQSPRPPAPTASAQEPIILKQYQELYEENKDLIGWIKIDGTVIDFPVMYTADDFYLNHDFNKDSSKSGVPYIDKRCTVAPFATNTIIYGHHMKNGKMFASLELYKDESYYKEHPIIQFDTLYEQQQFEIIAVFKSQIYRKSDTVFKHYNFLNAESESDFDEYMDNIKALSLYSTGRSAIYGDQLLTLSTCAYHTENGQFLVVARRK